jgi:hypothetical protein
MPTVLQEFLAFAGAGSTAIATNVMTATAESMNKRMLDSLFG